MFIRNPFFDEYYRKPLLGLQGEELGDRTWENESTTWKGYGAPLPSYVAFFFFHFKKNHRFVTEENIQVGKEEEKGGTEGGRKGKREERTKRGGKKGMRRTLWCLTDTSWRLWVVNLWFAVQSSRLCSCSWAELLGISSHVCPRTGHRIPL